MSYIRWIGMSACVGLIATAASVQAQTSVEPLSPRQGFSQQPWSGAGYVPRDYERQRGREWLGRGDADEFNQGVMPYGGWGEEESEQPFFDRGFGTRDFDRDRGFGMQQGFDRGFGDRDDFDRGFGAQGFDRDRDFDRGEGGMRQGFDQGFRDRDDFDRGFDAQGFDRDRDFDRGEGGMRQGFDQGFRDRDDFDRGFGVRPFDDRSDSFRQTQPGTGERFGNEGFRNGGTDAFGVPFNQPGFGRGGEQSERFGGGQFQQQTPRAGTQPGQMGGGRVGGQAGAGSSGGRAGGGAAHGGGGGGGGGRR